ncbi:MAG TPA: undecaprenyl-diphosphate phosphatase [Solirubrobacteraceae bacterium]|nr:undecaprenyl-diphosphate phosphatase [Solirubrobacteraceae bacterium]
MRLREAVALGALHGPAELLPISSSGHVELVPWLGRWEYAQLDGELRKAFEVALHAGTAAALLIALRGEIAEVAAGMDRRRLGLIACAAAVPAAVGLAFERPIERRLGGPRSIAAGLALGSVAMLAADRRGGRVDGRERDEAGLADALALGVAQACALMPGVSRTGATVSAARARGFRRRDASALSRHVALPVIAGATSLKAARLHRRGLPREHRAAFAAGTVAAFASTLVAARLVDDERPLWPLAAYRLGLAGTVLAVARRRRRAATADPRT